MLDGNRRYEFSEVFAAELAAVEGKTPAFTEADGTQVSFEAKMAAAAVDAAKAEIAVEKKPEAAERARRKAAYEQAHQLGLSALCLSGGGIRSASVSLGVLQALVDKKLLREFNYLSTVSGGGYIGAWLSAWLHRTGDAGIVIEQLRERRDDPDGEPPPLGHLRQYGNYLTPRLGVFSADTWAAVAIVLRNLAVNWLILIPAIAVPVVLVKLAATLLIPDQLAGPHTAYPRPTLAFFVALACLLMGWLAFGYKLYRLYAPPARDTGLAQRRFIVCSLLPAVVGGFCFVWLLMRGLTPAVLLGFDTVNDWLKPHLPARLLDPVLGGGAPNFAFGRVIEFALAVFAGAMVVRYLDRGASTAAPPPGEPVTPRYRMLLSDFFAWIVGVLVFATLIWIGTRFLADAGGPVTVIKNLCVKDGAPCVANPPVRAIDVTFDRRELAAIFGMPWFLLATMSAHTAYLLLRSSSDKGDVEREWLGRASGWHFIAGLSWMILAAVVLFGPKLYYNEHLIGENAGAWLTALTGASGSVTAFLGKSGLTPAQGGASGAKGIGANVTLAIAGPLFAVLLLTLISLVLDWGIAGSGHACFVKGEAVQCGPYAWVGWGVCLIAILGVADRFANVNRFSIHALYRNRLVRAYLGGARAPNRSPDGFTDFDWHDNVRMADLWDDEKPADKEANWRPFHVVNMTLNLAATKNLAWQQRKASSFTVTPQSCGNPHLGYRATQVYGGPVDDGSHTAGITLGTAMAISGAAVSPNMGYHSSPSISFLLTMFNVRLGWWLGNPGEAGAAVSTIDGKAYYEREGPLFALRPLLSELFGLTSDDSPYVYLSDGGHFEDLGLYEMVRRRCRWIVVCDDDQDGKRGFEDLGNAVRKIWIDLGVRIIFPDAPLLQAGADAKPADIPYFALGTIDYVSDNPDPGGKSPKGQLLYIKPIVRGDEDAADVIAYQRANPDFPAQTTGDQWFDEAQLEAYRRLGHLMTLRMISGAAGWRDPGNLAELFAGLAKVDPKTMKPRPAG
jgi:Patatin-like phospholipase